MRRLPDRLREAVTQRKSLRFGKGFRVAFNVRRAQAAEMVLAPGESEGGADNRHRGADQWLYVVAGTGVAVVEGQSVPLTTQEFELLALLARRAGELVSRDEVFRAMRGIDYDGLDRSIDGRVSKLRRKLGDDAAAPTRIKTVWGKGYLLVPDAWEQDLKAAP